MAKSYVEQLKALQAEQKALQEKALGELRSQLKEAEAEVARIQGDIRELGGEVPIPFGGKKRGRKPNAVKAAAAEKQSDLEDEKILAEIVKAGGGTANRKSFNDRGYNLGKNSKKFILSTGKYTLKSKGPQTTVTVKK